MMKHPWAKRQILSAPKIFLFAGTQALFVRSFASRRSDEFLVF